MGTKYEVSRLRKIAIVRLRHIYPSDLDEYRSLIEGVGDRGIGLPSTIAALSLARTCNVPSIVPLCFLLNSWVAASDTLKNRALRNGGVYTTEDGTVYTVSPEDSELCSTGAWKLSELRRHILHAAFTTRTGCQSEGCGYNKFRRMDEPQWTTTIPMPASTLFMKTFIRCWGFCAQCKSVVEPAWEEAVSLVWQDLPTFFDLPSWEELLAIE
jgi:hypothetical protein